MTAAATVLFTAAAVIWLAPLAVVAGCLVRDRAESRDDQRLRAQELLDDDADWFAEIAPTSEKPLFIAISMEFAARDLTDESLARAVEGWAK